MSSITRTIEKRILKSIGLKRETSRFEMVNGQPQIRNLRRGEGNIVASDGTSYGRTWPRVRSLGGGTYAVR